LIVYIIPVFKKIELHLRTLLNVQSLTFDSHLSSATQDLHPHSEAMAQTPSAAA
jgi:hypothetical protein